MTKTPSLEIFHTLGCRASRRFLILSVLLWVCPFQPASGLPLVIRERSNPVYHRSLPASVSGGLGGEIPQQRRPRHTSSDAPNRGCQGRRSIEVYRSPSRADTGSNRKGSGGCNNLRTKAS